MVVPDLQIDSNGLRLGEIQLKLEMKSILTRKITTIAAISIGLVTTAHAIIIGDTVEAGESGELGGVQFSVDFGSVEYVSDLSNGALRFNGSANSLSTSIFTEELNFAEETELAFDWMVMDRSDRNDFSWYQIEGLDAGISIFHDGLGMGNSSGTVSRFLSAGDYVLRIQSAVAFNRELYQLTVGNLRINPLESTTLPEQDGPNGSFITDVPDSSLGFLGIATILAVIGAHRRMGVRRDA